MKRSELERIKTRVMENEDFATSIMDGGDNYNGADGARTVLDLCDTVMYLVRELEPHVTE